MVRDNDIAWHTGNWSVNRESIGVENAGSTYRKGTFTDTESHLQELVAWRSRAAAARLRVSHPPHDDQWLCIHSHANWDNHDTGHNGHDGGLQMSFDFAKGTAHHWTPLEQLRVAERAWRVRGFQPWPETARMCGLLR